MEPRYKTYKIEMCPQRTGVLIFQNGKLDTCFNHGFDLYNPDKNYQHVGVNALFITSDEEPVDGDYYMRDGAVYQLVNNIKSFSDSLPSCKKIIASTNKTITPNALIPESFVIQYVDQFNLGKKIELVELKLREGRFVISMGKTGLNRHSSLEIDTCEDGYVSMMPQKTYSKREVIMLLDSFGKHVSKQILGKELEMIGELASWSPGKL